MAKNPQSPGDEAGDDSTTPPARPTSKARREEALAQLKKDQARRKRSSRLFLATAVVGALVLVVAVVVLIGLSSSGGNAKKTSAITASVDTKVTSVSSATFDAVGVGSANPQPTKLDGAPALTKDGKPRMLYVGAEYCPFCAAQRWAVVAALSRFGTFKGLGETFSSHTDVYPDTATLSFHGSTFTSDYLTFDGIEETTNQQQGNGYAPLDKLSSDDEALVNTYDTTKYTGSPGDGHPIPFVDIAGSYVSAGASFDPAILSGLTQEEIATEMSDPSSKVAQAVDGAANHYAAAICAVTGQKPATVCTSPGVTAAAPQ